MSFVVLPPEINSCRCSSVQALRRCWRQRQLDGACRVGDRSAIICVGHGQAGGSGVAGPAAAMAAAALRGVVDRGSAQSAGGGGTGTPVAQHLRRRRRPSAAVAPTATAFVQLVMTNLFGPERAVDLLTAEGVYEEMWAADVAAMSVLLGTSAIAAQVVPWASLLQRFPGLGAGATGATGGEASAPALPAAGVGTGGTVSVGTGGATASGGGVGYVGAAWRQVSGR